MQIRKLVGRVITLWTSHYFLGEFLSYGLSDLGSRWTSNSH